MKWFPDLSALIENSDHFHPPTVYPFCSCYDQSHQMWNFTWKTSSFVSVIDMAETNVAPGFTGPNRGLVNLNQNFDVRFG